MKADFAAALAAALGRPVAPEPDATVHGGSINDCLRWPTASGPVFVKRAPLARRWILEAEVDGLARLRATRCLRVPATLAAGCTERDAFLVLEWLDLAPGDAGSDERLGLALARLHALRGEAFGLDLDNALGATRQPNGWTHDWIAFWRERRLGFQLQLAAHNGYAGRLLDRGRRLLEQLAGFFAGHDPEPALLHGDLWGGNRAMLADATPVLFDPAVYVGDGECDLAMTRLFGGFGPRFYAAYESVRPAAAGASARRDLYNLYHVLNHLNLFGGVYRPQAESMIDRLLAAVGH
ncbi:MAG: fructosamine kinase family protein [Steroidobacteraceae bacterium]